jgi:transposase
MLAVAGVFAGLLALIVLRAVDLTLLRGPELARLAAQQHRARIELTPRRGPLVDRHGEPLALSLDVPSVYVRPREFGRQDARLAALAASDPAVRRLTTVPGVGPVTVEVVLSEIADIRRFRSAKDVVAYAGLAPGFRESAGKRQALAISKEGSRLLRWALVEAAWRLVRLSPRWRAIFEGLSGRRGRRKAIVAVARRLLTVMTAVWRSGARYRPAVG